MELKAVVARYQNADQLRQYKDALEAGGETNVLMWLVAPHIPPSVRDMLERIGIEYTEIHENQLRRVAARQQRNITENEKPVKLTSREDHHHDSLCEGVAAPSRRSGSITLLPSVDR